MITNNEKTFVLKKPFQLSFLFHLKITVAGVYEMRIANNNYYRNTGVDYFVQLYLYEIVYDIFYCYLTLFECDTRE